MRRSDGFLSDVDGAVTTAVTAAVKRLVCAVVVEELGNNELLAVLGLKSREDLRLRYIVPALELGLIERTQPSPHAPNQKYRLTAKGRQLVAALSERG